MMVSRNAAVAVAPLASDTVTVKLVPAMDVVGVPVIAPVKALIVNPLGSDGEMLYVRPPVPLAPVTGLKLLVALLCVRVLDATDCVAVTAAFTVRLNVAFAVALLESVTVTVKVVPASVDVEVPEIEPVELSIDRPVGSVGAMLYVSEPVPPLPVIGMTPAAWFCVSATEAMDCVAATAAFTVRLNVLVPVAPFWSVTVTVNVVAEIVAFGVPVMAPVEALKLTPEGRLGETL